MNNIYHVEKTEYGQRKKLEQYVLKMLKLGYTCEEIAARYTELEVNPNIILSIEYNLIARGSITVKEIENAKREDSELEQYVLEALKEGKSQVQISKNTNTNQANISKIKKRLIEEGRITEEEIKEARVTTQKKDNTNKQHSGMTIRKKLMMQAKRELKKSIRNDNRIDIDYAIKYAHYCEQELLAGTLEEEYIDLLKDLLALEPRLMENDTVQIVEKYYVRSNRPQLALKFINECINESNGNKKEREKLVECREAIKLYMRRQKARKMIQTTNYSEDDIANSVGLTGREVREMKAKMLEEKRQNDDLDDER